VARLMKIVFNVRQNNGNMHGIHVTWGCLSVAGDDAEIRVGGMVQVVHPVPGMHGMVGPPHMIAFAAAEFVVPAPALVPPIAVPVPLPPVGVVPVAAAPPIAAPVLVPPVAAPLVAAAAPIVPNPYAMPPAPAAAAAPPPPAAVALAAPAHGN
jgi:hypothetical protein